RRRIQVLDIFLRPDQPRADKGAQAGPKQPPRAGAQPQAPQAANDLADSGTLIGKRRRSGERRQATLPTAQVLPAPGAYFGGPNQTSTSVA
ncbi:unnamed protein product, partial [Ascophyllum nodosum]